MVLDVAVALVLLAGAGVMLRTVMRLLHADTGFDARGVLTLRVELPGKRYAEDAAVVALQHRLLERVRAIHGVDDAAIAGQVPLGGIFDGFGVHAEGRMHANPEEDPGAQRYAVTPSYFSLLHVPLVAGRLFTEADRAGSEPVAIVSTTAARAIWANDSPLGARLRIGDPSTGPWRVVVGVVGDVRHMEISAPPLAALYLPQTQSTDSAFVLLVKTRAPNPKALVPTITAAMHALDPGAPVFQAATMGELVGRSVADRRFVARLLAFFGAVSLLLAAIGLYGVVAYAVAQRRREVGIRIALGATRGDVLRALVGQGARTMAMGLGIGMTLALLAMRALRALVFGVSVADPASFAAACVLLLAMGIAAHWLPIRRALRGSPVSALRPD